MAAQQGARAGTQQGVIDAASQIPQRQLDAILPGAAPAGAPAAPAAAPVDAAQPVAGAPPAIYQADAFGLDPAARAQPVAGAPPAIYQPAGAIRAEWDWQPQLVPALAITPPPEPVSPAPVALPQPVARQEPTPEFIPDAPYRLAENVTIIVQPRADDADATADAVRLAIEERQTAGRGGD